VYSNLNVHNPKYIRSFRHLARSKIFRYWIFPTHMGKWQPSNLLFDYCVHILIMNAEVDCTWEVLNHLRYNCFAPPQ
jgi:hypothetical protein